MEHDTELFQNNLAYNLIVIKALWKSDRGNYGESGIKGHEYDFSSLYRSIEKGKETIRLYIKCEYNYKKTSIRNWAKRIEAKTGIPYEYLTGEQRIELGSQFEEKKYPMYTTYLLKKEAISKQLDDAQAYAESPKENEEHLDFDSAEEIKQYVKTNFSPEEQKEFFNSIKEADATVTLFAHFNLCLRKETDRIIKLDIADLMQQNEKLCKMVYFIRYKKKYDGISILTIDDMKTMMKKTKTSQLCQLGKKGLKEYINMLEEHLNLARSVYTVAIDYGYFTAEKKGKK